MTYHTGANSSLTSRLHQKCFSIERSVRQPKISSNPSDRADTKLDPVAAWQTGSSVTPGSRL